MKICHNALVAEIQNGVNETLALALREGIDIDKFSAAISYGGGQNYYYDSKQMALRYKDYTTQFSVDNMAKDLEICHNLVAPKIMRCRGLKQPAVFMQKHLKKAMETRIFVQHWKL